ncbi:hydrolase [Bacillus sp. FJAT-27225]|uniref:hydrolase n=1 Tax=Bacillus sp. FJAT-27225 TaxID=1743144 RepID=UPI00080C3120|nr:hydrolase [Bacillus sp. FJAT-27225]OCA84272.1 hydrolase [Bacillus sp. FJAT-27225]
MENRHFQLENEWSAIYYPEKPTGFGVMVFGDERHFVNGKTSFWKQNTGKRQILSALKGAGYTLFTSNFHGKHWGSTKAVLLASTLYSYVMKNEILNGKIHILAEGMGALAALKFAKEMEGQIRSIVLINPILSLKLHLEQEKEHKFFYKKVLFEIAKAYEVDSKEATRQIEAEPPPDMAVGAPIRIFYILSGGRAYKQSRTCKDLLEAARGEAQITETFMLPEKVTQIGGEIAKFMSRYEKVL